VAEANHANVGDVSAADMTQAGLAAKVRSAEMRSAEMRSAEMTATTEVATATVAAAATACKGVGRETQPAECDARQEHSCHLGYHDFSHDIRTARVHAPDRSSESSLCVEAT
jgi:hypothetical protein